MAPNAMKYSAIARPAELLERKAQKPEVSLKLSAAVAVCAMALFFAGRFNSTPSEFSHTEVMNVASFCAGGQFIGGCQECKTCAFYEFENGGCSYFKDTFCSYCQPIANCPRESTMCTTEYNSQCQLCDCNDPIRDWGEPVVEDYKDKYEFRQNMMTNLESKTYSCYIADNPDDPAQPGTCEACKVCPYGFYQVAACDPTTNTDTQCARCTQCAEHEFTATECAYAADSVCQACDYCADDGGKTQGTWTKEACVRGSFNSAGQNAVCKECAYCGEGEYVTDFCAAGARVNNAPGLGSDTQCTACAVCEGATEFTVDTSQWKEHINGWNGVCKKGERYEGDGCSDDSKEGGRCVNHDTVCTDCIIPEDQGDDFWFAETCIATKIRPPVFKNCDRCGGNTYTVRECDEFHAAICKPCSDNQRADPFSGKMQTGLLPHCDMEYTQCNGDGTFVDAFMGVHHSMVDEASACTEDGSDEAHCEFSSEATDSSKMILSWCAMPDPGGQRCGDDDKNECNVDACEEGFLGTQCQYAKVLSGCGTDYYLERSAKKGRSWYDDQPLHVDVAFPHANGRNMFSWTVWCMNECESSPFCHAFEIQDGGTGPTKSGDAGVTGDSMCRLFTSEGLDFCPTGDAGTGAYDDEDTFTQESLSEPNWAKDCYVNTLREDQGWQERVKGCPGDNPAPAPAMAECVLDGSCEMDMESMHNCNSLFTGLTWCDALSACVDQSTTPCPRKPAKFFDHQDCPAGTKWCFCTGSCLNPNTDQCTDPIPDGTGYDLDGRLRNTCWEVSMGCPPGTHAMGEGGCMADMMMRSMDDDE